MAINDKQRRQSATKAGKLLPGATVLEYTVGRAGPHPLAAGWLMLLAFIVFGVIVAAATGILLFPGLLGFIVLQHFLNPPRAVVVCDQGVALTDRSLLNGNPVHVLDRVGFHEVLPGTATFRRVPVQVGAHRVWLPEKELGLLAAAIGYASSPLVAPPPA